MRDLLFQISVFWGAFQIFLGVFLVFLGSSGFLGGCSWFSWVCYGFFGGVPGFWVFRDVPGCSGVPVFRVPVFLEVLHARAYGPRDVYGLIPPFSVFISYLYFNATHCITQSWSEFDFL